MTMAQAPCQSYGNPGWLLLACAWHQNAIFPTMLRICEPALKTGTHFTWMMGHYCLSFFFTKRDIFSRSDTAKAVVLIESRELMKLPLHPSGLK